MGSALLFVGTVLVVAIASLLIFVGGPRDSYEFLRDNPKITSGIVMFLFFGIAIAFASSTFSAEDEGKWLAYGEVYLGLDYTKEISPMCHTGATNDKLTSNGGLRFNIYQSADKKFETNFKYTHHSCAFNDDNGPYDAFGVEATYKLFAR